MKLLKNLFVIRWFLAATLPFAGGSWPALSSASDAYAEIVAAVLPSSRSAQVNAPVTAFATIVNGGTETATGCRIELGNLPGAALVYQTTDPTTNALTGTADTPVDITAGNDQSFVISITPASAFSALETEFNFICANAGPALVTVGVNTLLLSASTTPVPDIVALVATNPNNGVLALQSNQGAFSVASVNLGSADAITVSVGTGGVSLPVQLNLCETDPSNGQCISSIAQSITTTIASNATPTFSVFATASNAIQSLPQTNRIVVSFMDSASNVRGSTSVAVEGGSGPAPETASASALTVVDRILDLLFGAAGTNGASPSVSPPRGAVPNTPRDVTEILACDTSGEVTFVGTVDTDVSPFTLDGNMNFANCDSITGDIGISSTGLLSGSGIDLDIAMNGTVMADDCSAVTFTNFDVTTEASLIGRITDPIIANGMVSGVCTNEGFSCSLTNVDLDDRDAFAQSCQ